MRTTTFCLACALGVCGVAGHIAYVASERPDEPCVYTAPCSPLPPMADIPEQQHHQPRPVIGARIAYETSVSTITSGGYRPWLTGQVS